MRLILNNGYPYPFPAGFDVEAEDYDPRDYSVTLAGVVHFEWLHTVTVEFNNEENYEAAKTLTGWEVWSASDLILEAPTSGPDGYDHPAIIVGGKAYCGFILQQEVQP